MKKATLSKLFAAVLAVALCIPAAITAAPIAANAVSGNTASGGESSGSSESAPAAVTASTNTIVTGNGRVTSSIGGIHTATAVSATVVSTPKANLASAIGLSEADLQAGTNIRSYICDNRDKASKAALQSAAEAAGKTVAGYVNMDLYTITKKGVVSKVTASTEPVTIKIGRAHV